MEISSANHAPAGQIVPVPPNLTVIELGRYKLKHPLQLIIWKGSRWASISSVANAVGRCGDVTRRRISKLQRTADVGQVEVLGKIQWMAEAELREAFRDANFSRTTLLDEPFILAVLDDMHHPARRGPTSKIGSTDSENGRIAGAAESATP